MRNHNWISIPYFGKIVGGPADFEVLMISSRSREAFLQHSNNKPSMLRKYWSAHQRISFYESTNCFYKLKKHCFKNEWILKSWKLLKKFDKIKRKHICLTAVQNYVCKTLSRNVYANTSKLPKCIPGQA